MGPDEQAIKEVQDVTEDPEVGVQKNNEHLLMKFNKIAWNFGG